MMVWLYYTSMIILLGGEFNYRTYLRLLEKSKCKEVKKQEDTSANFGK